MTAAPGGTQATVALVRAGVAYTAHSYAHDPAERHFGDETATALGVDPARLFKTLVVTTDAGLILGIVAVADQLDLKALAAVAGVKRADLADPRVAERATGYLVGGISPFGQKSRLRTWLDETALAFPTVFVSGGKRGLQVELAPADLVRACGAGVARIGR